MESNEIMEMNEVMDCEVIETEDERSGLSTGGAIAVGVILTAAVAGVVKLGKTVWAKYKAHKELRKPEHDVECSDEDIEEVVE